MGNKRLPYGVTEPSVEKAFKGMPKKCRECPGALSAMGGVAAAKARLEVGSDSAEHVAFIVADATADLTVAGLVAREIGCKGPNEDGGCSSGEVIGAVNAQAKYGMGDDKAEFNQWLDRDNRVKGVGFKRA